MKDIDIFISYTHMNKDKAFADELEERLRKNWEVWKDNKIRSGKIWEPEIHKHLGIAPLVIVIVSPDSMKSMYVAYEWCRAKFELNKELYAIYLRECSDADGYFSHLKGKIQLTHLLDSSNLSQEIEVVSEEIDKILAPMREIKQHRDILTDRNTETEAKIEATHKLANITGLHSVVSEAFNQALRHQLQYGYGEVQIELAKVLEQRSDPHCIPDLVKLFPIATKGNDYYGKVVGEAIMSALATLYYSTNKD